MKATGCNQCWYSPFTTIVARTNKCRWVVSRIGKVRCMHVLFGYTYFKSVQCLGRFLGIISQNPSISKSNQLCTYCDLSFFFFINLKYIPWITFWMVSNNHGALDLNLVIFKTQLVLSITSGQFSLFIEWVCGLVRSKNKRLVTRVLCPSIILHMWPIMVGYLTKTKFWLNFGDNFTWRITCN